MRLQQHPSTVTAAETFTITKWVHTATTRKRSSHQREFDKVSKSGRLCITQTSTYAPLGTLFAILACTGLGVTIYSL